jgi:hypothetical protein
MERNMAKTASVKQLVGIILLSWLVAIGIDFLLHASILAPLYAQPDPFLLLPERAFALIPLGYLSFLLLTVMLVWLMDRLSITTWKDGLNFGLILGALIWGSFILGLLSIATVKPILALSWFLGQTVELGIAGLVAGIGFGAESLKKLALWAAAIFIASLVAGVVLQNI